MTSEGYRELILRILDVCDVAATVDILTGARTTVVEIRALGPKARGKLFGSLGAALHTITNMFGKKTGRRHLLVLLDEKGNRR